VNISSLNASNDLIIGNIYRPPRNNKQYYDNFNKEFSSLFQTIDNMSSSIIVCGDFNANLLKINDSSQISEFLDTMLSFGLIPKITHPTRFSSNTSTLIDNAFCKITHNFSETTAGILTCNISDHLPYFVTLDNLYMKEHLPKYVTVRKFTTENKEIQ